MLTKEELVNTYIKYSSDITEEIFNKIIDKLEELGFKKYLNASRNKEYKYFINGFPQLRIDNKYWFVASVNEGYKEIQVSDIIGENNQFEVGKWYKHKETTTLYLNPSRNEVIWSYGKFDKDYKSTENINDWLLLTDLSEIQQYLPDGHPDKLPKTIEKWSVGSYVVFLQKYSASSKGTIDVIKEFDYSLSSSYLEKEGIAPGYLDRELNNYLKWFATLSEAEAFSKSLLEPEEPKPLSVNDLVKGEIYLVEYSSGGQYINLSNGKGDVNCYIDIRNKEYHKSSTCGGAINYTIASPEEKKWLLTCIKQDKFVPQDQLDMYDSEGNLLEDKPKFKVGDYIITNRYSSLYNGRILRITKFSDRYPDIAYFEVFDDGYYSKNDNFSLDKVERFATSEEIAKVTKPKEKPFEFNKWYKRIEPECSKILIFVHDDGYYGFDFNGKWFNRSYFDYNESGKEKLTSATTEEVKERLLSYAKEKYPIGTKFKELNVPYSLKEFNETEFNYYPEQDQLTCGQSIYIGGKWAKVISKPEPKESKEFDRNWYVEVNSQEEADKVFEYLESIGEVIVADENYNRKYLPDAGEGYKYIYYRGAEWFLGENPRNRPQKQLSDILPNYSKVNRNVYYEVSNQEEYEEISDWLKSMGEDVCTSSIVTKDWKYIYRDNVWCLDKVKPDLPKAEFPFKSKQSIKVNTSFEEAGPFPSLKGFIVDLSDVTISEQVICPTIVETPTNEEEIISKKKKSIEF